MGVRVDLAASPPSGGAGSHVKSGALWEEIMANTRGYALLEATNADVVVANHAPIEEVIWLALLAWALSARIARNARKSGAVGAVRASTAFVSSAHLHVFAVLAVGCAAFLTGHTHRTAIFPVATSEPFATVTQCRCEIACITRQLGAVVT